MAGTHFGGRTLARSQAMQLLFQAEATGRTVSDVLETGYVIDEGPLDEYAERLARGADAMLWELDGIMAATSTNWSVSRMPATDRNLVRLALYEMLMVDEVDVAVAIDECVELAKAYGTDESSRFVNGLLGKVARRIEAGEDVVATTVAALEAEAAALAAAADADAAGAGSDAVADAGVAAEDDASAGTADVVGAGVGINDDADEVAGAGHDTGADAGAAAADADDLPAWARV